MNPNSLHAAPAHPVRRLLALRDRVSAWVSHDLLALGARAALAGVFLQSGRTKVEGLLSVTDAAVSLFEDEYRLPLLPPDVAAHLAAYAEHAFPVLLVLPLREAPAMRGVLDALFTEAFNERSGRDAALNRLSEVVLVYLLRHAIEHGLLRAGVVAGLGDARLAKALNAMHAAPQRPWTLQGLADLAGMSRARFAAHFGEVVGEPAIEYLAGWRLSVAQGLLAQGRQVKSIADEVGYGSPNALTRAFTQRLGQAPTEWLALRRSPAAPA